MACTLFNEYLTRRQPPRSSLGISETIHDAISLVVVSLDYDGDDPLKNLHPDDGRHKRIRRGKTRWVWKKSWYMGEVSHSGYYNLRYFIRRRTSMEGIRQELGVD